RCRRPAGGHHQLGMKPLVAANSGGKEQPMSRSVSARLAAAAGYLCALASMPQAFASDCTQTSVGKTPINDLGAGLYLNQYSGGLYPDSSNTIPPAHASAGLTKAQAIVPRSVNGQPSPDGCYILLSIGMSNTTQEYTRFMQIAATD